MWEEPSTDTKTPSNVADNKPIPAGPSLREAGECAAEALQRGHAAGGAEEGNRQSGAREVEKKPESSKTVARK